MELKDPETPKKSKNLPLRRFSLPGLLRCAQKFRKARDKDCEKVLRAKVCRKFFGKVTALGDGVKKSTTASIIDSVFNLKSLSFPALVKAKSNASLIINNEAIF